jgi:fatty-acyl-CoA synthase
MQLNGEGKAAQAPQRGVIRDRADILAIEARGLEGSGIPRSTYDMIARTAALHPHRPAVIHLPEGTADDEPVTMDFSTFLAQVNRAANLFRSLDIGREDCVALLLPTLPQTLIALFGAQLAGRVCPINYMLSPDHIAELIDHAGASVLVTLGPDEALPIWDKVASVKAKSRKLRHVLQVGGDGNAGSEDFDALLAAQPDVQPEAPAIRADDIAAYFHTGGTTGLPKLVVHSHANEVHVSWHAGMVYDIGPEDVVLNGFPMFHVAGAFVLAGAAIAAGAATLIPSRLGMRNKAFVRDYWKVVERHRVSLLSGGPTFVSTILNQSPGTSDISHVKGLFGGGSPMPVEMAASFERKFAIPVRAIYGMTEAAGMICAVPRHAERVAGSSGWPLPFCEVRAFADDGTGMPDAARPLPAGEHGLLAIRGPNVSPGYSTPEATAGSRIDGGWLATGDTGRVDPDGQVHVLGRSKDVIIRGGHNIDPLVIEEAIMHHPDVELCAAVGQPDPYSGELPVAFLKLKPGAATPPQDILDATRAHIPEPAAIPKQLYVMDDIPLTTTGKIFKPALRQLATERALRRQLDELLPQGSLIDLNCREELGQRRITIRLAPGGDGGARDVVVAHMARFAMPYAFSGE